MIDTGANLQLEKKSRSKVKNLPISNAEDM
jgi:hypothetical protein